MPPGQFWDGKREMVRAACAGLSTETLLWQIDSDELWTADQIQAAHQMFVATPTKTAARYWCHYYVGPKLEILDRYCYGNGEFDWLRTWRARPDDVWQAHEPPTLTRDGVRLCDNAFSQAETEAHGLVFEHYAYVTEEQLAFKEAYYGYAKARRQWQKLQQASLPAQLEHYFHWARGSARVGHRPAGGLASYDARTKQWSFAGINAAGARQVDAA
jgi:hypothetical protein